METEMIVGALVYTFVQTTIDSLASRFVDYFGGRKHNKKLMMADDAEQKQFRDPRVRDWLLKAKDVVVSFEKEIESRMKQILDDLDDLASQIDDLGLETASDVGVESN
ncbi:hypothetical protein GmHk_04G010461 [Glycine max]|nr:hypothetical protein GmHk_04G010461 [Glycine max]